MPNHNQQVQAIKRVLDNLGGENRNVIRVVADLCMIATTVERLECYADSEATLHVLFNGREAFEYGLCGAKSNFRNLLAVMFGFAKQFAVRPLDTELSPYKIDCILNS